MECFFIPNKFSLLVLKERVVDAKFLIGNVVMVKSLMCFYNITVNYKTYTKYILSEGVAGKEG